jgi:CrcB protein
MPTALAIGVAGAAGALCRYAVQALVEPRLPEFPWGTLIVNISGAFLLGFLFTLTTERTAVAPWVRTAITVGFLGAYTTFSTLAFETVQLLNGRSYLAAALNMAGSGVLGLLAVVAGIALGRALA